MSSGSVRNRGRAYLELGIFGVLSSIHYWLRYHDFVEDWQYELTFKDQFRRFFSTEAIRLDSNSFAINGIHVPGGMLYYQMARTNRLTWLESMLGTFLSSLFYEYVSEWREVIAINDMIVTTFGGYSAGEAWFQLSDYFHHQKSPFFKFLAFMNPVLKFNYWLDRKKPESKVYTNPDLHDHVLSVGWRRSTGGTGISPLDAAFIGLETQILRMPEYGRTGTFRKTLKDTSSSEMTVGFTLRRRHPDEPGLHDGWIEEADFFARVVSLAVYRQNIDALGRGYSLSIGLGSALSYIRKRSPLYDSKDVKVRFDPLPEVPTNFRDKMILTHIAGPVVDWTRFFKNGKIRSLVDAYLDFAMISAYAFNAYTAFYPIEAMKTTLNYYGYYYAFGLTFSGRVDLEWRNLQLRGLASYHIWDSIEGVDRFQDDLTNDSSLVDSRTRYYVRAGWRLSKFPFRLFVALEGIRRWGKIEDIRSKGRETRLFTGLAYHF